MSPTPRLCDWCQTGHVTPAALAHHDHRCGRCQYRSDRTNDLRYNRSPKGRLARQHSQRRYEIRWGHESSGATHRLIQRHHKWLNENL